MALSCRKFRILFKFYLNNDILLKRKFSVSMNDAISKAEMVLGYSMKELSVKQLACDTKFQVLMKKIPFLNDEHPVVLAEKKLDPEFEPNYKSRALLTLLLAKVVEAKTLPQFKFNIDLQKSGYLAKQLLLAETIELINGGCVYHTIGMSPINELSSDKKKTLINGNRLAILKGDLMFSTATKNLVKLKNSRVTHLMSKSLRQFVEGEYLNIKSKEQIISGHWSHILDNWVKMTFLKNASLISNGCQSMINLSGNCESIEESVNKFGNNIGFAWKLVEELQSFNQSLNIISIKNFEIIDSTLSLPILLYLNSNPELKTQINESDKTSFFKNIISEVNKSDAIEKTKSLLDFYSMNAITQLKDFEDSEAKTALLNMIIALKID